MVIEKFKIRNLFGMYNIDLNLNDIVTIYVGENGLGKTTILNCLYYVLTYNFDKLKDINFESIEIEFESKRKFRINYTDILEYTRDRMNYNNYEDARYYRYIQDIFNEEDIVKVINIVKNEQYDMSTILRKYGLKLSEVTGMPLRIAERTIYRFCLERLNNKVEGNAENVVKLLEFIKENSISDNVIYFTTYRRIEKNVFDTNKNTREYDDIRMRKANNLIHFGMDDILDLINKNLDNIRTLAISGYNEMTGLLLKQYLESDIKESEKYKINSQKLNIALDRIGDKIDEKTKNKIKKEIVNNNCLKDENKYLLNLLENLIKNYEKQNEYDEKIRNFANTCNKYLNGKKFEYNESSVEVKIINLESDTPISINNLSSGEKQIISIFAKLYLDTEKKSILLIDEPELSLSIKWQSMLIPDIVSTNKCEKIVVVTHSPFIFDNEYERNTKSMKNVFKYKG